MSAVELEGEVRQPSLLDEWLDRICGYEMQNGNGLRLCDCLAPSIYKEFKAALRDGLKCYGEDALAYAAGVAKPYAGKPPETVLHASQIKKSRSAQE